MRRKINPKVQGHVILTNTVVAECEVSLPLTLTFCSIIAVTLEPISSSSNLHSLTPEPFQDKLQVYLYLFYMSTGSTAAHNP
jgi:hypothetical protein